MNEAPPSPVVSLVIPVLNERESLGELHRQIAEVAVAHRLDLEILFIDDGSTDGSWEVIRRLSGEDPRVRGVRFRRNFNKAAALRAGFQRARGRFVITLDADLQDGGEAKESSAQNEEAQPSHPARAHQMSSDAAVTPDRR
jgi:glycosyltransferase involved in cell wall biosynthesis